MKKLTLTVCLILGLLIMAAPMAMADNYQISSFSNWGPYQTGTGGEFTLKPNADLSWVLNYYVAGVTSNLTGYPGSLQTFCVESGEYIYLNTTYDVTLSQTSALTGTHLTKGAAYLYHEFQSGTLDGYNYGGTVAERKASAAALQNTIWFFMGIGSTHDTNFYNMGMDNGGTAPTDGTEGVAIMNLWVPDTGHTHTIARQDQLVCVPVPEPGILILLGIAMSAIGMASYRIRKL